MEDNKRRNFTTTLNTAKRVDLEAIALATGCNLNELIEEMIQAKKLDVIAKKYGNDETKFEVLREIAKTKLSDKKKK